MKSCPTCKRTYPDDTLAFCLMDGAVLSAPYDSSDSGRRPPMRGSDASPTEVLIAPTVAAEKRLPIQSTIHAPALQLPLHANQQMHYSPAEQKAESGLFRGAWILRGLTVIGFAVMVFFFPVRTTYLFAASLFTGYALVSCACAIVAGIKAFRCHRTGWLLFLDAILGGFIGLILFAWIVGNLESIFRMDLFIWMELFGIVSGLLQIGTALQLRKHIAATWLLALAGTTSMTYGCGLFAFETFRHFTFVPVFGLATLHAVAGVSLVVFGLRAQSIRSKPI